jgi:hypothetical protein
MADMRSLPEPAQTFLRPRRAVPRTLPRRDQPGLSSNPRQVCFSLAALMGFHLQGFAPPGDRVRVSASHPPLPLRNALRRPTGFEGLIPPGSSAPAEAETPALLALIPSEVLPLDATPHSFLQDSSHALENPTW